MKVGDYVYDWELGLWGLILSTHQRRVAPQGYVDNRFVLLYEDGERGEAYENALSPSNVVES